MKIGRLRYMVNIESLVQTIDAMGAPTREWSLVCSTWADITSVSAREMFSNGTPNAENVVRIVVRAQNTFINAHMRVTEVGTGMIYEIQTVVASPRRDYLTLVCRSGVNNG